MRPEKRLVLIGGGHGNLQILRGLCHGSKSGRSNSSGFAITLVSEFPQTPYSGMIPGFSAGIYSFDQTLIPLKSYVANCGAVFKQGRLQAIHASERRLQFNDGSELEFDELVLNTGAISQSPSGGPHLSLRPLTAWMETWVELRESLLEKDQIQILIVGGGAAACELAVAISEFFSSHSAQGRLNLKLTSLSQILPNYPPVATRLMQEIFVQKQIQILPQPPPSSILEQQDLCLWATGPQKGMELEFVDLQRNENGFFKVDQSFRCLGQENIWALGDVAEFPTPLPRSGVMAVHEGRFLSTLLKHQGTLTNSFQVPQKTLNLLFAGQNRALGIFGKFVMEGRSPGWLKHRIDTNYVKSFYQSRSI